MGRLVPDTSDCIAEEFRTLAFARSHFPMLTEWGVDDFSTVIAEVYPVLWSRGLPREGRTADQHDAFSVAAWLRHADLDGTLAEFFKPGLTPKEQAIAQIEGWILGIK